MKRGKVFRSQRKTERKRINEAVKERKRHEQRFVAQPPQKRRNH